VARNGTDIPYLDFALALVRFTATKNIFRVELYRYLNGMNGAISVESLKTTLKILIRELEQIKNRYAELWKLTYRNWWLDRNMKKFDDFGQDLRMVRGLTVFNISDTLTAAGRTVKMRSMLDNLPVYYTLDGTVPTINSVKYSNPVGLKSDATIRARVIAEGKVFPETVDSLIVHKAIGKLYKLNSTWSPYHPAYEAGGKLGLLDGRTGNVKDFRSGRWQGYSGQDINMEIDFGRVDTLHSLSMGFYQYTFSWIILPRSLDIYYSNDGLTYKKYASLTHTIPVDCPEAVTYRFETNLNNLKTRYLKVVGVNFGPLPESHPSKGNDSFLFADELIIR
jgi:hypothetical protein